MCNDWLSTITDSLFHTLLLADRWRVRTNRRLAIKSGPNNYVKSALNTYFVSFHSHLQDFGPFCSQYKIEYIQKPFDA